MLLYIANKNYSSWSFRPWLAMKVSGVGFQEKLVPFDDGSGNAAFHAFSPTGRVPVLVDGETTIWESLAIIEYVAERFPDVGLWPPGVAAKAIARSLSAEMHAGFSALRAECPMNMRRERRAIPVSVAVRKDVARIEDIVSGTLARSGGPFLFGAFSAADAMYAPVVNRLDVYELTDHADTLAYMDAVMRLPHWREWQAAAKAEPWVVEADEA